jgi:hypothetical protein
MNRDPDDEVRFAIEMTQLCQALNCLPGPGGLLQQDSYYVWMMQIVLHAEAEKAQREQERKK